jgi:DNA-binding protein HU-beta
MKIMNKFELVGKIAEKMTVATEKKVSKASAELILKAVLESIEEGVEQDGKVQLVGFGAFEKRARAERKGRNPSTQEEIIIPATNTVAFKASKNLKELVNV